MDLKALKVRLDEEVRLRNVCGELCEERPDPLMIARRHGDEYNALTCALFAYGNAKAIVSFLASHDAGWLDMDEAALRERLVGRYYRFQNSEDIVQWYLTLKRMREDMGLEEAFMQGYRKGDVIDGLTSLIDALYRVNPYRSGGYVFLIGKPISKRSEASAMKRWMMYLRWMVRSDALDMGLWKAVDRADLIVPLDTHTFNVSRRLGLLNRRQCDMKAALELTETLKSFDPLDPVKYDFALYRIGQEKKL